MRLFAMLALTVSVAAPASAFRVARGLPLPPPRVDYVETLCTGGFAGRYDQVRVLATGQIQKSVLRAPVRTAWASRAEMRRIWRDLDLARFEQRTVPPEKPYIADGIDCSLTRRSHGQVKAVMLIQQMRDKPKYRDLAKAIDDINALGNRATGPIMRPAEARR